VEFLLDNLPILICLLVGTALLIVEVFMPGFGLPGIAGLILLAGSIFLTWTRYGATAGLGVTLIVLALSGISVSVSLKSAATGRISRSALILRESESREEGYAAARDMDMFLGKEGVALSTLRPAGIAEFDGVRLNVVSDGEYIQKGAQVSIDKVEGARIVVKELKI
jgi:membrane-bound ClpP family serine protease